MTNPAEALASELLIDRLTQDQDEIVRNNYELMNGVGSMFSILKERDAVTGHIGATKRALGDETVQTEVFAALMDVMLAQRDDFDLSEEETVASGRVAHEHSVNRQEKARHESVIRDLSPAESPFKFLIVESMRSGLAEERLKVQFITASLFTSIGSVLRTLERRAEKNAQINETLMELGDQAIQQGAYATLIECMSARREEFGISEEEVVDFGGAIYHLLEDRLEAAREAQPAVESDII